MKSKAHSESTAVAGHTASFKYISSTFACVNHQAVAGTPKWKPHESLCGLFQLQADHTPHADANPTYSGHESRIALQRARDERPFVEQHHHGAKTITCFGAMPATQANVANTNHARAAALRATIDPLSNSCRRRVGQPPNIAG